MQCSNLYAYVPSALRVQRHLARAAKRQEHGPGRVWRSRVLKDPPRKLVHRRTQPGKGRVYKRRF
jgi:hypothetical protein